jgi:hypothetical protein
MAGSWQSVRFTRETVPGTYQTSAPPADTCLPRLYGDNAFPGRPQPMYWGPLMTADSYNRPIQTGSSQVQTKGSLHTLWQLALSKPILNWAIGLSGTPPDLASATWDHQYRRGDASNTIAYQRHLGSKCRQLRLTATNSGRGNLFTMDVDYDFLTTAVITGTDFAVPTLASYPAAAPFTFQQTSGQFTLNTLRTKYRRVSLTVANTLDPLYDEGATPNTIVWGGRTVTLEAEFRLVAATDRTDYNAVTPRTCTLAVSDGTNTITFDLHGSGIITAVEDNLPLGSAPYQRLTFSGYVDVTAGSDLDVTIAP